MRKKGEWEGAMWDLCFRLCPHLPLHRAGRECVCVCMGGGTPTCQGMMSWNLAPKY